MRRTSPLALLALVLTVLAGSGGCGYSMVRYQDAIPGAGTLAIEPLSNESYEPGVEAVMLEALRREALQRSGLRLIEDPETADIVISGAVSSLIIQPRSFSSVVLALEYEVFLQIQLAARNADGEPLILDGRAQYERDFYLSSADIEATRKNRRETIHRMANVLADRVYDSLYESSATP